MKRDFLNIYALIIFLAVSWPCLALEFKDEISIQGSKIYVGRSPFFVKAIGYAPWRPGQVPGLDPVKDELVEIDFKRIKEIGFNTIRTWDALTPSQLSLARKYDLKVIQGIWLDPSHDLTDPVFISDALAKVRSVAGYSKDYSNVIMYLVMTEPKPEMVTYSGTEGTKTFFAKMRQAIKAIDNKPISMDSWLSIGYLDHQDWDVVTVNAFAFTPASIIKVVGFEYYVWWLRKNIAGAKPFMVGETGGFSVSKRRLNDIGFGGNSLTSQAVEDLRSFKTAIDVGAAGVSVVSWADTWHYPTDTKVHDDHPWEWDGFIHFGDGANLLGEARKVVQDFKDYFNESSLDSHEVLNFEELNIKTKAVYGSTDVVNIELTIEGIGKKKIKTGIFWPIGWKEQMYEIYLDANGKGKLIVEGNAYRGNQKFLLAVSEGGFYRGMIWVDLKGNDRYLKPNQDRFYVYRDKDYPGNHFYPSGWIGDRANLEFDDNIQEGCSDGKTCIKVKYLPQGSQGWAGIFWQNPVYNWDSPQGAYSLTGFKSLDFWARGDRGSEVLSILGAGGDRPNSTDIRMEHVVLTDQWKMYSIKLPIKLNLIHGFKFIILKDDNPQGASFFLDNISFRR